MMYIQSTYINMISRLIFRLRKGFTQRQISIVEKKKTHILYKRDELWNDNDYNEGIHKFKSERITAIGEERERENYRQREKHSKSHRWVFYVPNTITVNQLGPRFFKHNNSWGQRHRMLFKKDQRRSDPSPCNADNVRFSIQSLASFNVGFVQ